MLTLNAPENSSLSLCGQLLGLGLLGRAWPGLSDNGRGPSSVEVASEGLRILLAVKLKTTPCHHHLGCGGLGYSRAWARSIPELVTPLVGSSNSRIHTSDLSLYDYQNIGPRKGREGGKQWGLHRECRYGRSLISCKAPSK